MNHKKINTLLSLSNDAQEWLKKELIKQLNYKTYRELQEITRLDLKQLKRIVKNETTIKIDALIKAIQGLLDNTSKSSKPKKRREVMPSNGKWLYVRFFNDLKI